MRVFVPFFHALAFAILLTRPLFGAEKEMDAKHMERLAARFLPGVEALPAEDQARLRAARDKALLTPEVQAALVDRSGTARDFGNVQQTALLKADPKLSPVLDQLKKKGRNVGQLSALGSGKARALLSELPEEERQQLLTAFRGIRSLPEVAAARQRMVTANQAANKAVNAMMVKSDPTVEPLLGKLGGPFGKQSGARRMAQ